MCKSNVWDANRYRDAKWPSSRIDPCITHLVNALNGHPQMVTLASCCGHGVYPLTVIVKDYEQEGRIFELLTGKEIKGRSKKFYRADRKGRYYVPEVSEPKNE